MNDNNHYMKTGEVGFCPKDGELTEVVVLPQDRLQARIAKKARALDELGVADCELPLAIGRTVHLLRMSANDILDDWWVAIVDDGLNREALEGLLETLIDHQAKLCLLAELLGDQLDRPLDLLRLAAERLEV
jgi:hypothetical protein